MFDDEESELKRKAGLPVDLARLSVKELDGYHSMLREEMFRVEVERERKEVLHKSANHFFKPL